MKLVHLSGFIIKKFVTMHGHMNVKNFIHFLLKNLQRHVSAFRILEKKINAVVLYYIFRHFIKLLAVMIVARCKICTGYLRGRSDSNTTCANGDSFEYPSPKSLDTKSPRRGWDSRVSCHTKIKYRQSLLWTE